MKGLPTSQKPVPSHISRNIVFGVNITQFKPAFQFTFCALSVIVLYLLYGFVQEKLFRIPGFRGHGWYLSFIQFTFVTIFAGFDSKFLSKSIRSNEMLPYYDFMFLSWLTVGTIGLSTVSLGFLNFPTQVIFKSCKLIPVMIGGIFILGNKYKLVDYISVMFMTVGLIWFSLADQTVSPQFNVKGIILICMALALDGVYSNFQEKLMKKNRHLTNASIVFYAYAFGTLMILTWMMSTGQLWESAKFVSAHPEVYGLAMVYSVIHYIGNQFVLALIKCSSALITVIVTTMRKVLTIVLSFMFFAKPFTFQYVWSGSLVFLGISISIYTKNRESILFGISAMLRSLHKFQVAHRTPISKQPQLLQKV